MNNIGAAEVLSPGEYIKMELEARGWTQANLADILGHTTQTVSEIIIGKRGITAETAAGIAAAFGTSVYVWINLQAAYDLSQTGK